MKPLLIANDDKGHPVHGVVGGVHLPESRLNGRSDCLMGESQFDLKDVRCQMSDGSMESILLVLFR